MKKEVFERYANAVAKAFAIDRESLFVKSKLRDLSEPRHMLYYLCSIRPMSVAFIRKFMEESGYKTTHAAIGYGVKSMKEKVMEDIDYGRLVDKIVEDDLA